LKARQIGFSTLYSALTFWECFFWPDRESSFFSIGEKEARVLLRHTRFGYRKLPEWVKARGPTLLDSNMERMTFNNESSIESLPTGEDPGRGRTFYRVIFDEFASLDNQDDAYASIEPTVDLGGRLNIVSTAKGAGSVFERLFTEARLGHNKFVAHFNSWNAAKWRDDAWYAAKEREYRSMPHKLHQEYPRDEHEAFVRAGNAVFNLDDLRSSVTCAPLWRGHLMVTERGSTIVENPEGDFCMWEKPVDKVRYAIGADVARGLEIGDWSTAHVLRADTGAMVARVRTKMEPEPWGRYLAELAGLYNNALLGIENNTFGLSTNNAAAARGTTNLFRMRSYKQRSPDQKDEWGWSTNAQSKPLAISNLQEWLPVHNVPDEDTLHELRTYVFVKNGRMEGSPHDDLVMSLAIGVKMLEYVHLAEYMPAKTTKYGSLSWYREQLPKAAGMLRMGATAARS
jgi:hypothetical protein